MQVAISSNRQIPNIVPAIRRLWNVHAPLTLSALLTGAFTLFFIAGIFAASRVITGVPAWLKPAKFGISITIYTLTLTWILSFIKGRPRIVNVLGWTVVLTFLLEWVAILTQVVRGTTSHFNVATPFDTALVSVMGGAIAILWTANFVIAGLLLFQRFDDPAFAWSLRLAMILTVVGMGLGFLMTSPTAQQMAAWEAGAPVTIAGAHAVGVPDGGPGLPVTGWSVTGGDLRVPHFVGMHALQVLPFVGWLVSRRRRWPAAQRVALVWTAAVSYLGLVGLVTWQALRAQPVIAPDTLTLSALAGLVLATATAVALIRRSARRLEPLTA